MAENPPLKKSITGGVATSGTVPKLCTTINMSVMNNQHVILSMLFNDSPENIVLIDSFVISIEHAKLFHKFIANVLKDNGHAVD